MLLDGIVNSSGDSAVIKLIYFLTRHRFRVKVEFTVRRLRQTIKFYNLNFCATLSTPKQWTVQKLELESFMVEVEAVALG